jgi:hypothetical protein
MCKRILVGCALTSVLLTGEVSWAGRKVPGAVIIDLDDSEVRGGVGAARNSGDTVQEIGCEVSSSGGVETLYCWGKTAAGVSRACLTRNTVMVSTAKTIGTDSYIRFQYSGGSCVFLTVSNGSLFEPKAP